MWRVMLPLLMFAGIVACTSVDCSIENTVSCNWQFEAVDSVSANYALTISSSRINDGNDTVLVNKSALSSLLRLPMSYSLDADTLFLTFSDGTEIVGYDVVVLEKSNEPYFEDVDCGARMYHTLQNVEYSRNVIDTLFISSPKVNTNASRENIHIIMHPAQ